MKQQNLRRLEEKREVPITNNKLQIPVGIVVFGIFLKVLAPRVTLSNENVNFHLKLKKKKKRKRKDVKAL